MDVHSTPERVAFLTCQNGRWWRHCGALTAGVCQYCGQEFCRDHGELFTDGQNICGRSVCRAKFQDVIVFRGYKRQVLERNSTQECGAGGCGSPLWGVCSKCTGSFCEGHLSMHTERTRVGRSVHQRPLSVCAHCAQRLSLWAPGPRWPVASDQWSAEGPLTTGDCSSYVSVTLIVW
ncbi:MAG: hypothetical protein HYY05_02220 [Chloroflexi bacterium]|nr:hypothetical protein [Chloroflexota bacterium]